MSKEYYLYILRSNTNQLYVGITQDLDERIKRHNNKDGAKFTKTGSNFVLVYKEEYPDLLSAMRREKQIKGWTSILVPKNCTTALEGK